MVSIKIYPRLLTIRILFAVGVIAAFTSIAGNIAQADECPVVAEAEKIASELRGLKQLKKVPCKRQNKDAVEKSIRKLLHEKVSEHKLKSEERLFKMIGFIPADYDYEEGMIKLYKEQIAGYYDPAKDFYVMVEDQFGGEANQKIVAIHELTHALQDQHFDLERLIHNEEFASDTLLARSAMVEG